MMFGGSLKAISSILLCVTLNGVKSREVISKVIKLDKALLCDSSATYRKALIFILVQVIVVHSYEAALFICDTWVWTHAVDNLSVWYFISGYPHRTLNMQTTLEFSDLVLLIRNRLQALNSRLSFMLRECVEPDFVVFSNVTRELVPRSAVMANEIPVTGVKSVKRTFIGSPQHVNLRQPLFKISQQRNIRSARELYDEMCDIRDLANSMYGFQLLLELGVTTAELTLSSYLMLATILGIQSVEINTIGQFISLMAAWQVQYAFKLIIITAPCQSATNEVENMAVLVQKLLLVRDFDQGTVAELQLFSQQLLQRKMKFTAFGFLSLDHSLLFTIVGGVTTFIVIAMQFKA
ncbi:hypothetical protein B7P43_G02458 [Cryptotermes secundus]|uniref:Gustatory receptor n=2 Tax=Cryptotermes secundus TaxID=105785 RepID=A0A2J7QVC2_9NEOP|nr:hypothetical protein B7P43_G02458 [Cryptotermes secundus]